VLHRGRARFARIVEGATYFTVEGHDFSRAIKSLKDGASAPALNTDH